MTSMNSARLNVNKLSISCTRSIVSLRSIRQGRRPLLPPYLLSSYTTSTASNKHHESDAVIVSFARTPMGSLNGALASVSATKLGAVAIKNALEKIRMDPMLVDEAFLGNVLSAGLGQAPARQAVLGAGLPIGTICTTVNKVCASGMKAVMLAAQAVQLGSANIVIAGGFESMTNVPYYLKDARKGYRLGHQTVLDGIITDGLWDVYNDRHMGMCGEKCAETYGISRAEQDEYAIQSYNRATSAWREGRFHDEVTAHVTVAPAKKGSNDVPPKVVIEDEEFRRVNLDKFTDLRTAFKKDGTITAANAATINDGAAAMVIMSAKKAEELSLGPRVIARIRGYADAARAPDEFTVAPNDAIPKALKTAGVTANDVHYYEINEAFAVVALANMKLLKLDPSYVNVNGGAVSLGHPLGMSGARIIGALCTVLQQKDATIGCASICNGGGGASAVVIERVN